MPRNVEIKAIANDFIVQMGLASDLSDAPRIVIRQTDTFFVVPAGRLKLREFSDGSGELIQYTRLDEAGPTQSSYFRAPTSDPNSLKNVLENALGVRAVVKKKRTLFLVDQIRIHMDEVANLGKYIELEAVLQSEQSVQEGRRMVEDLMTALKIAPQDLVDEAYVDLIERSDSPG